MSESNDEAVDRVPNDPETTAFKRRARLHQSMWREKHGHPIGFHPYRPKSGGEFRPLGSRLEFEHAYRTGANFLHEAVLRSVVERLANPQSHQMINEARLYCDLLSSMPMCFNLFGVLASDLELANRAVHQWWPTTPGIVTAVHFEWSPGRAIPGRFLENRSAFDVAFELDLGNGKKGILGIETKYHEDCKAEKVPSAARVQRYTEISEAAGCFSKEAFSKILGTDLQQIWQDHLLALSLPLDSSGDWHWANFVLVHPKQNPSYARAMERYLSLLHDRSTIHVATVEELVDADVLPPELTRPFRERYLWGDGEG